MTDKKTLIIIGAGGHGKVAADCASETKQFETIQFLDGKFPELQQVESWKVVGHQDNFASFDSENAWFFVAIGNNAIRHQKQQMLLKGGQKIATLIHPNACIAKDVNIGNGSLILAGVVVNIAADIGAGCIINTGATVDHDCQLGQFSHVAPGVNLAGAVTLGCEVFIGIGSAVIPCLSIGDKSIVGAGSVVLADLPEHVTAVGSPAKVIKRS